MIARSRVKHSSVNSCTNTAKWKDLPAAFARRTLHVNSVQTLIKYLPQGNYKLLFRQN